MPDYIEFTIETDPDALAADAFAYVQTKVPGWAPNAGNLEVIAIEAMARMVAEARDVASAVPKAIFRYFGNSILGITPIDDTSALGDTTWVARDTAGYTIPAGTQIGLRAAGDELIAFHTLFTVTIPPGSTSTGAGAVSVAASVAGSHASGLIGTAELIDTLDWVSSITFVNYTVGGQDAESDASYLNRLATQLTLLTPVPILPQDFALFALNQPGVGRALAIDGYNPDDLSLNNERMVAVVLTDINGEPLTATFKDDVDIALQSVREINFIVNIIDPTYTTIDVNASFTILPSNVPSIVADNVDAAITDYLSPANWGAPQSFGESGQSREWRNLTTVELYEIVTIINNVPGVDRISSLGIAIAGDPLGQIDINLPGAAPATRPGTITAVAV